MVARAANKGPRFMKGVEQPGRACISLIVILLFTVLAFTFMSLCLEYSFPFSPCDAGRIDWSGGFSHVSH